ncbi:UDP-glucose 4-epimerase GalE [Schlesneria sp. DSM 10557]|uniref:UDP-glucose 4-epimerase GalE n=1 Tax=Schlesneria sp. DSM 10557 TaxID=3044399 RepID=UPI0035A0720B
MSFLVTGGAGYIGSHATRLFLSRGHDVVVYDNLSRGHEAAVPQGRLIVGELTDRQLLASTLREYDVEGVVHFAGLTYVGESVEDPALYYQTNVAGTLSLLDAVRAANVRRVVFSSTAAVYGMPDSCPIHEECSRSPINPYGRTKLMVEQILADYQTAYGIGFVALRYFNAAGADASGELGEDHAPETHLIPLVLQVALGQRKSIAVFGNDYDTPDGTCIRDYIHVNDLADAHLRALEWLEPGKAGAFNLGTGHGHSVREIIDVCRAVTGKEIPEVIRDRRPGDPARLVASSEAARRELGWKPRFTDIQEIVATAWNWHSKRPAGYRTSHSNASR